MTAFQENIDRKVVPRWHSLDGAQRDGELAPLRDKPQLDLDEYEAELHEREEDWRRERSVSFAADLVSSSVVLGRSQAADEAAAYLLDRPDAPPLAVALAHHLLGTTPLGPTSHDPDAALIPEARRLQTAVAIHRLRDSLAVDPRNALRWSSLARLYASIGQDDHAHHAMNIALNLAPTNRFILRSAARLSLHRNDPERAHRLLIDPARRQGDPWLVAAEIALAPLAGKSSRLIKLGRQIADSGSFSPRHTTELASALATEELSASLKRARRRFGQALEAPTENTIAQVEWASRQGRGLDFDPEYLERPDTFEARAWANAFKGDWEPALGDAWQWLSVQPFASAPAVFGSHQATLGEAYEEGVAFSQAGLLANPDDVTLLNNLAYCLINLGRLSEAEDVLRNVHRWRMDATEASVLQATRGLLAYRQGDRETGRRLYAGTITDAANPAIRAIAAIVLAREEALARTPYADTAHAVADELSAAALQSESAPPPFIELMFRQLVNAASAVQSS
jgi:Flp pilus assembly protein TadD